MLSWKNTRVRALWSRISGINICFSRVWWNWLLSRGDKLKILVFWGKCSCKWPGFKQTFGNYLYSQMVGCMYLLRKYSVLMNLLVWYFAQNKEYTLNSSVISKYNLWASSFSPASYLFLVGEEDNDIYLLW